MNNYMPGAPMPKTIGRCADLYAETRELRLAMEKEVDPIRKREAELREHIIDNLSKSDDTGAAGLRYQARIVTKVKYRPKDWDQIWTYVVENGRFDLLQKRLAEKAVADTIDVEGEMPGIETLEIPEVSITKLG